MAGLVWGALVGFGTGIVAAPECEARFGNRPTIGGGIREQLVMLIDYTALDGRHSRRRIRPLQMEYWGRAWTCTGWCEERSDFRVFRVDRINDILVPGDRFEQEPGQPLVDYLKRFEAR